MRYFRHLAYGFALLVLAQLSACELVADFDRSKLPSDKPDSGPLLLDATTLSDQDGGLPDEASSAKR
jgi:hypothetical protein